MREKLLLDRVRGYGIYALNQLVRVGLGRRRRTLGRRGLETSENVNVPAVGVRVVEFRGEFDAARKLDRATELSSLQSGNK